MLFRSVSKQTPTKAQAKKAKKAKKLKAKRAKANRLKAKKAKKLKAKKKVTKKKTKLRSLGTFKITGYCPCSSCCGKSNGITASGKRATAGRTIAADTSKLPMGTKVVINGHTYTVEDVGGGVRGNHIDMFFSSHSAALQWGVRYHPLALEGGIALVEHLLGEVAQAEAGGLGAGQGAAGAGVLAGEYAAELVADALVLAEHIADLPAAHAHVAGGHVGIGADVALQLDHKGLAETHDLVVALALGIEVGAALAAAHGQAGEGVFEDLLKAQELDDRQVHAGVEAQATLGGADGGGELHPVALVDQIGRAHV